MVCRAIGHPLPQAQSDLVLKPSKIFSMASKLKDALTNMFRKIQMMISSGKLELLAATKHNIKYENYLDEIKTDYRRAMTNIMECPNVRIQSLRVDALNNIITLLPQFKMLPMHENYIYAVSCYDIS